MHKNRSQGFTLIELLVVIAIIGILSAVVLASLNTARSKGQDAKVQTQIQSVQTAAEIYYSTNGNYGTSASNICNQASGDIYGLYNLMLATNYPDSVAPTCSTDAGASAATKWSAHHKLSTFVAASASAPGYWCSDSTGQSKSEMSNVTMPTSGAACP